MQPLVLPARRDTCVAATTDIQEAPSNCSDHGAFRERIQSHAENVAQTAAAHVSDPAGGAREGDWKDAYATADRAEEESIGELERLCLVTREARGVPRRGSSAERSGAHLGVETES